MNAAAESLAPTVPPATGHAGEWLVFFGEDWGRHASTAQFLAAELAHTRPVLWINSLGLRTPRPGIADLRRVIAKLRAARTQERHPAKCPDADGPVVCAPLAVPLLGLPGVRACNRRLLRRQLRRVLDAHGIVRPTVVVACPAAVDALDALDPGFVVYYCADDHAAFPGMNARRVRRLEAELLARCDRVVASSRLLVERHARHHADVRYLPHGVSHARMREALARPPRPPGLPATGRPVAGFVGQMSAHIDWGLVAEVMARLPGIDFVFVGPVVAGTRPPAAVNARFVGPRPHQELPRWLAAFDVALMPFADSPRVRAAHPTKIREYLAAGLPVVATPHPELAGLSPWIRVAREPGEFARAVADYAAGAAQRDRAAIAAPMAAHDWSHRAVAFAGMLQP